jgi:hypothetical protein
VRMRETNGGKECSGRRGSYKKNFNSWGRENLMSG